MITKEQIGVLITKRATEQFSRDVYRLGLIMAQNYGELKIEDMQRILINENKEKSGVFKFFTRKNKQIVMSEEENDRYYLMQLAFKIMEIRSVNKLSLEDLSPKILRPLYLKYFRKEYEEYERAEYAFRDVPFQESVARVIEEYKGRTISIESELI